MTALYCKAYIPGTCWIQIYGWHTPQWPDYKAVSYPSSLQMAAPACCQVFHVGHIECTCDSWPSNATQSARSQNCHLSWLHWSALPWPCWLIPSYSHFTSEQWCRSWEQTCERWINTAAPLWTSNKKCIIKQQMCCLSLSVLNSTISRNGAIPRPRMQTCANDLRQFITVARVKFSCVLVLGLTIALQYITLVFSIDSNHYIL